MSFAGETKGELCRTALNRKCCTQAEAYGVLLYCNTFSGREIRIITENEVLPSGSLSCSARRSASPLTVCLMGRGSTASASRTLPSWQQ